MCPEATTVKSDHNVGERLTHLGTSHAENAQVVHVDEPDLAGRRLAVCASEEDSRRSVIVEDLLGLDTSHSFHGAFTSHLGKIKAPTEAHGERSPKQVQLVTSVQNAALQDDTRNAEFIRCRLTNTKIT